MLVGKEGPQPLTATRLGPGGASVLDKTVNFRASKMMFNRDLLRAFANSANDSNVSYYAVRRTLFEKFTMSIDRNGEIELDNSTVITIRTFLSTRVNNPSSDARLAYEVAVMTINELVG